MQVFSDQESDIDVLAEVLEIPERFVYHRGTDVDGIEGLCLLLKRLFAYPCRLSDMIKRFGCPVPGLIMITTHVFRYIYGVHHHHLY